MTARAYAKINLGLRILRKRDDGYHDIETVFHRINLFDEITFEPATTISLTSDRTDLPSDESNLCVRAAILLQRRFGSHQGVFMTLKKHIPIGAGLGGGSADAAAVLLTVPALWNVIARYEELHEMATELGADVPYFLRPGTAYATGRGDILEYFDFDIPYWIVVAFPHLHISTRWAYQNVKLTPRDAKLMPLKDIVREQIHNPRMLMNLLQNDFESLVLRTYGSVAQLKKTLYDRGAVFAQMSGSGSSVYGLFEEEELARAVVNELGGQFFVSLTHANFTIEHAT